MRSQVPRKAMAGGALLLALAAGAGVLPTRAEKRAPGASFELPVPASKLAEIVAKVAGDTVIRGTSEYQKEDTLTGAVPADSSNAFERWTGPGQIFYKVRRDAIAPAHFLESEDIGTVTVRYVVEPVTADSSRIRLDAVFIATGRHRRHPSDGSVETAEFGEISLRLKAVEQKKEEEKQQAESKAQEQQQALNQLRASLEDENARLAAATDSIASLEKRAVQLRRQVLMRVKATGVPLKAAPFHHADTLLSLSPGEVVSVQIRTPYWLGVQRKQGQRGWVYHAFLEVLP